LAAGIVGVAGCTRVLWAVLILLIA
jgi:hypothetical protein